MSWNRWTPRWSPWGQGGPPPPGYHPSDHDYRAADGYDRDRPRNSAHPSAPYSTYVSNRTPATYREQSPPRRPRRETQHETDVLVLSYRSNLYPIHFKAYSVDDGLLTVGDVRDEALRILREVHPERMRMFFKGKKLEDRRIICADYGFRSKVADRILVTEASDRPLPMPSSPPEPSRTQPEDALEDDSGSSEGDDSSKPTSATSSAVGKKRKSKKKKKKSKGVGSTTGSSTTSSALPYPTGNLEYLPMPTGSHPAHRMPSPTIPQPTPSTTSGRTRSPGPPSKAGSGSSTTGTSTSTAPSSVPSGPMAKLESIAAQFHTTLLPRCHAFLQDPPPEKAKRQQEVKKLTLTIEQNVVLKYDGIEHDGNEEVRMRRKALVKEAQDWLGKLDSAVEG